MEEVLEVDARPRDPRRLGKTSLNTHTLASLYEAFEPGEAQHNLGSVYPVGEWRHRH